MGKYSIFYLLVEANQVTRSFWSCLLRHPVVSPRLLLSRLRSAPYVRQLSMVLICCAVQGENGFHGRLRYWVGRPSCQRLCKYYHGWRRIRAMQQVRVRRLRCTDLFLRLCRSSVSFSTETRTRDASIGRIRRSRQAHLRRCESDLSMVGYLSTTRHENADRGLFRGPCADR